MCREHFPTEGSLPAVSCNSSMSPTPYQFLASLSHNRQSMKPPATSQPTVYVLVAPKCGTLPYSVNHRHQVLSDGLKKYCRQGSQSVFPTRCYSSSLEGATNR